MRAKNLTIPLFVSLMALFACSGGGGGNGAGEVTPSASLSTLAVDRLTAPADGTTEVLLTAVVRDTGGAELVGRNVRFDVAGSGFTLDPAATVSLNGGIATAKLTATVPGPVSVTATVSPDRGGVRLDQQVTVSFLAQNTPVVAGPARYEDADRDGQLDIGDRLIVPFSMPVDVVGSSVGAFELPVQQDEFGVGATIAAGPAPNEVTVTLGVEPTLRTRGRFAAGFTDENEPSGIDVASGQTSIFAVGSGVPASASTPADIGPMPVPATVAPLGGDEVAVGDVDGNGTLDVLAADGGVLRPFVNDGGVFVESGAVNGQVANDLAMANLNRIGAAEAVTAEAAGVQVWSNSAVGGSVPAFTQAQLLAIGDTRVIALADVDADGFPDIVAGTTSGVVVAIHQRNLGNTYAIEQTINLGAAVLDLQVFDFDRDGDLDVFAAVGPGGVRVLVGDSGQLQAVDEIAVAGATGLAVGDVDVDGRMDLAVVAATVSIVRNTVADFVVEPTSVAGDQAVFVDLDGDAFDDLIVRSSNGIAYLLNDRAAAFVPLGAEQRADLRELADLDVDGDGDRDIVAIDDGSLRSFEGSLAGTFGNTELVDALQLASGDVGKQQLADLDNDGNVDRVVARADGVQVWLGDGQGGFAVASTFGASQPTAIALGDVDNDLDIDCVLGFDGSNQVYLNGGLATFSFAGDFAPGSLTRSFGLTDFDRDGDLDVFVGNDGDNQLFVNGGIGDFTESAVALQTVLPQALGNETIAVLVFDFDREGDEDIILINGGDLTSPQNAYVLRRSGDGYSLLSTLNAQLLATAATIADVDGDGREDLAIAQLSSNGSASIKWFRGFNTSLSTLSSNIATNGQYFSRSLIVADINGDGRSDFVVGDVSVANQPIAVVEQQADGSFAVSQEIPTTRLEQVDAGDFDRDGDVDLVTVESTGPSRVLQNR